MTDIVERLRYRGGHAVDDEDSILMREAADEIERLRKERDEFTEMDYTAELAKRDEEIGRLRDQMPAADAIERSRNAETELQAQNAMLRSEIERLRADNKDLMEDHRALHEARVEIERLREELAKQNNLNYDAADKIERLHKIETAARALKFSAYPEHGGDFVIMVSGGNINDLEEALK